MEIRISWTVAPEWSDQTQGDGGSKVYTHSLVAIQEMAAVEHYVNLVPGVVTGDLGSIVELDEAIARSTAKYLVDWRSRWTEQILEPGQTIAGHTCGHVATGACDADADCPNFAGVQS